MPEDNLKAVIEALLFASDKPLTIEQIRKVLDNLDVGVVRRTVEELRADYVQSNKGMQIIEVAGGFRMVTAPGFAPFLKKLFKERHVERLSRPALETLAIIAYKQPITKQEIELLRNVSVDGLISNLLEKGLIRICGRKKAPGRPYVFGTTRQFLECFGLRSLEELPKMDGIPSLPSSTGQSEIDEMVVSQEEEMNEPQKTAQ
ncbi:MAG: SMC-Scp complex subunit ScpB [Candidatus Omnitrophica bacterium]|nr:SMC-Scp complex subunit ScpB [Candidatus Omnitrophota bacterium]